MIRGKRPQAKRRSRRTYADTLWSRYIRRSGRCDRCGRVGIPLEGAHIIPRRVMPTRHHPLNGLCLCVDCHDWFDQPASAVERIAFINAQIGENVYEELLALARTRWNGDYDGPIAELGRLLKEAA